MTTPKAYKQLLDLYLDYQKRNGLKGSPQSLYDPANYILSLEGKRVRPLLCLIGYDLFKENLERALPLALATEIFHNFTLVHDDIMDNAPLRRGRATVHEKWDINQGILTGDVMLVRSYSTLLSLDSSSEKRQLIISEFSQMAEEVCQGQQLDVEYAEMDAVSEEMYLEMIRLKTSVLLGYSLKSGALLAGASSYNADKLYSFGVHLGMAFQIMDDYLDAFGAKTNVGKQVGGDILENKRTLLLIHLLREASEEDRLVIDDQFLNPSPTKKIKFFLEMYQKYDVESYVTQVMDREFEKAEQLLALVDAKRSKGLINQITSMLKKRQS